MATKTGAGLDALTETDTPPPKTGGPQFAEAKITAHGTTADREREAAEWAVANPTATLKQIRAHLEDLYQGKAIGQGRLAEIKRHVVASGSPQLPPKSRAKAAPWGSVDPSTKARTQIAALHARNELVHNGTLSIATIVKVMKALGLVQISIGPNGETSFKTVDDE